MINTIKTNISAQLHQQIALSKQKASQGLTWQNANALKVLLITEKSRIPQSQIFPFYYFAKQFKARWDIEFREINIDEFEDLKNDLPRHADRIIFQPWLVKGEKKIVQLLDRLKKQNPKAKIAFFDTNTPTDLRFAETVNPYIDWYVKKHVLLNRLEYSKITLGDTRLVEYYNRLCHEPEAKQVFFPVSQSLFDKLLIGPSFFTSRDMLPYFHYSSVPITTKKKITLNARFKTKGSLWFSSMRERALKSCMDIPFEDMVITDSSITDKHYKKELQASKACFSPFGYGEVCWRDFEAILAGALLFKPDMSHVETVPNIFIPFKTYVPVAWDFSDIEDRVSYYLDNEDIADNITETAYKTIHQYINNGGILNQYAKIFD